MNFYGAFVKAGAKVGIKSKPANYFSKIFNNC
jgi:hypothetical protein